MKKLFTVLSLAAVLPSVALAAQDNVGGCGLGSMVFKGQSGIAPQVLAVTTNGTSGNQTFGITSGTLGCSQDGMVHSNMKTAMFIENNKEQLAHDMSIGSGETLDSLALLIGVESRDQVAFNQVAKENLARIFPSDNVATEQIIKSLREVLASDTTLSRYKAAI